METLDFDLLKLAYHLGIAVIVGGGLVLGLIVAPAINRALPGSSEAQTVFGAILGRFAGLALLALVVVASATVLRAISFEVPDQRTVVRWIALVIMALATLYSSAWASPLSRQLRAHTQDFDELPPNAAARTEFAKLHSAARSAMSVAALAGLVAVFLT